HVGPAVIELADDFEEHSRLVLSLCRRHPGEGGAVVAHGLLAGRPLALAGVDQNELAAVGVAALAVAGQALGNRDFGPDLILEIVVHGRGAPGGRLEQFVVTDNAGWECHPGDDGKDKRTSLREHGSPRGRSRAAGTNHGRARTRARKDLIVPCSWT